MIPTGVLPIGRVSTTSAYAKKIKNYAKHAQSTRNELLYLSESGTRTRKYGSETYVPYGTYGRVEIDVTNSKK